jgi:lipopolysaccharide export LptBFGC system permease protein LptF
MDIMGNMLRDLGNSIYNSQEIKTLIVSVFSLIVLFLCYLFFRYAHSYKVKVIGSIISMLVFLILYGIMY